MGTIIFDDGCSPQTDTKHLEHKEGSDGPFFEQLSELWDSHVHGVVPVQVVGLFQVLFRLVPCERTQHIYEAYIKERLFLNFSYLCC